MGKRKKTGGARSGAKPSKSRPGGRTHSIANSGTEPDVHHSTTTSRVELSVSAKRIAGKNSARIPESYSRLTLQAIHPFKVSPPYFSVARREWRIECYEKWGPTFQEERQENYSFADEVDADEAYVSFQKVKTWREWDGVVAAIRDEENRRRQNHTPKGGVV